MFLPVTGRTSLAIFLLTCNVLLRTIGEAEENREYYRAAVYEHLRYDGNIGDSPRQIVQTNLRAYATAIETAANQEVDIIVMPEWGLYPNNKTNREILKSYTEDVPDPLTKQWNPCRQEEIFEDRLILRRLSCLARDNKIFVVANMADMKLCNSGEEKCDAQNVDNCRPVTRKCHPDGRTFYNTNVVFDRRGNLVARYHKTHLYFETDFSSPDIPKPSFFETDFGNFTTFICFDMIFWEAVEAVEKHGVWNVAYSTYWYDHFPASLSISYQQAWAMVNKINLLAANAHLPGTGSLGSGIYSGNRGALAYTFNPDSKSKLLISNVPVTKDFGSEHLLNDDDPQLYVIEGGIATKVKYSDQDSKVPEQCSAKILGAPQSLEHQYRCKEFSSDGYEFKKLQGLSGSLEVCSNDLCCSLSYEADSMDEEFYLGASAIPPSAYSDTLGLCLKICMLIRCNKGEDGKICDTYPMRSNTIFRHVQLQGVFSSKYVYPTVIKSGMRLAPVREWSYVVTDDRKSTLVFKPPPNAAHPLSTISLYERCYDRDIPVKTEDILK